MSSSASEQPTSTAASKPGGSLSTVAERYDFAPTPLGAVAGWPACLQTIGEMVLANRLAMLVLWGPERLAIYNDAFVDLVGGPSALSLGVPAHALNLDVWSAIAPVADEVASGAGGAIRDHLPLRISRSGNRCETYGRLTCGPIPRSQDAPGGVIVTIEDTGASVQDGRRLRVLARVAEKLHEAAASCVDVDATCAVAVEALAADAADAPFALVCAAEPEGQALRVVARAGAAHAPLELVVHQMLPLALCGDAVAAALAGQATPNVPALATNVFGADQCLAFVQPLRASSTSGRPFVLITGVPPQGPDPTQAVLLKAVGQQVDMALARAQAMQAYHSSSDEALNLRRRLEALCVQAPTPIAILRGADFVIEVANPAACRAWGRNAADVINRPLLTVLPELEGQDFVRTLNKVWRTGVTEVGKETKANLRRGAHGELQSVYFNFVYAPLQSCAGEMDGIAVLAFEVTDQVLAHAEMDRLRLDAESANRTKDEFLAMLGHELRNPLSPIVTSLHLLRMRGAEFRELNVMERQVNHLVRLVDDLLDIARITQGRVELRKESLQIGSVIRRAVEMASPLLDRKAQQLDLRIASGAGLVKGDLARLSQVVSNLLTNASKFSERGTLITLTAGRVGEVMRLSVRDEGVGIAPHMLERVFDSFVQGRQSIDRAAGGLGLGLAIVRSLVSLHGGNVYALSEGLGKGAEFVVELPLQDAGITGVAEFVDRTSAGQDITSNHTRILVVDDNDDAAAMLAEALADFGYEVEVAHDGPSAMQAAKRFHPDIALLDIGLPVMDGYELAQRLRDSDRGLRLIAVTGYGQEEDRRRSREAGFAAHLVKPVNLDTLTKVMRLES